ncbi:hypothetical protein CGRA01v4_13688 [Colletotrichum graminicola]|uniref:DUF7730 domain-containing protein n=1 Tax=Colletotrichum graminicola (strain M1.001 / M2 / FGSC 10212) TaxID=645133 RepID=E3QX55_COLGM|nr:uncharacterized protein GLRG_10587 [Colletotrichum graminicola M1.001]EFQ35443.1 hypothetical protein GLRG_10587 [Colletotrichum graminicola M1.001]WDK22398.1 hypothetical protein CGRA01v4_13688 [Colletotrichum graminicola]
MTTIDGPPRSLTLAAGGLHTPPFDNSPSNGNQSASVQTFPIQVNTIATDHQVPTAGSSSAEDSTLESTVEDLQVTGESHAAPASLSRGLPGFGVELHTNGLIVLNSHEGEGTRRYYNPDEDEVDSDDGEAVSEDGLELHSGIRASSDEPSYNDEDDAEVAEKMDEQANEGSEPDGGEEEYDSMSTAGDNDDDFSLPQPPPIDLDRVGCRGECRRDFRQGVDFYEKQVEALQDRLRNLTMTNTDLKTKLHKATRQIDILKNPNPKKRTVRTWHEKLHLSITNPGHKDALPYSEIYKLCCKEENMSSKPENVHPNLRLRRPKANELQADALGGLLMGNSRDGSDSEPEGDNQGPAAERRDGPEALFVQDDEQTGVEQPQEVSVLSNLSFEQFPAKIQANIFKWVYIQEGKLIHCISRLDPYMPPEEPTGTNVDRSGLPHRFHLSGKSCNVTYAIKPNMHLALLSVCKRWHYLGVHAFYGLNTFAFSSLGEFGRFCTGIGAARRERIQHVELLWMGNQYLTQKPVKEGKELKWASKRAWDASWLCQMRRLKSLTIHIDESGSGYRRRKHEPAGHVDWMASMTAGQPNFRLTRSLRTLQGLDFIYQLRGMEFIQFYDYEMCRINGGRHPIRDWSFYMDIENVTAMPKTGDRAQEAEFENLTPVLRDFVLADEYLEAIKVLYRQSEAFDARHISSANGEEVGDEHADAEIPDIVRPAERRNTMASRAVTDMEIDEDDEVKLLDVAMPADRRNATASRVVTGAEHPDGDRKTTDTKKLSTAFEVGYDSAEDGSGTEDNDATPKANMLNARSGSAFSNASTFGEDGIGSSYGDEVSVAGSSKEKPIDLDSFEPEQTPQPTQLQHELDMKREPSVAVSIGPYSSRESERSFDSGSGLFLRSPTMSRSRTQRESTEMTETLQKRGFEDSEVRKVIDLTEFEDEPSSMSTGYPSSSQTSFTQQTHRHQPATFNLLTQLRNNPIRARPDSEEEETPVFKKPRLG